MEKTSCKECGKKLQSINGRKINIAIIIIWALTGKLIIVNVFDSIAVVGLVTLLVVGPIILIIRSGLIEYKIDEENETAL